MRFFARHDIRGPQRIPAVQAGCDAQRQAADANRLALCSPDWRIRRTVHVGHFRQTVPRTHHPAQCDGQFTLLGQPR